MTQAPAQFKKQNGTLTLSAEGASAVLWTPSGAATPSVTIPLLDITNLQQTPETSAKASIRITAQDKADTFTFTSATARDDQQAITSTLRTWIESAKTAQSSATPAASTPVADSGRVQSAAMAIAQAVSSRKTDDDSYDDAKLMRDAELQKSLLNSSPALRQRFDQALRDKPDSITIAQFVSQFWATRVHLLRSHAAEKAQGPGTYNVLSVVKPQVIAADVKVYNITKEQIKLIFAQYPLVKRMYNENVPPMAERAFWERFFKSRLPKQLKGERVTDNDPADPKFDKYFNLDDNTDEQAQQLTMSTVPRFIDLEGNEQNHSQRQGNRPDWTMQPAAYDKVPILRTLNRMSEKMMAEVPPADSDRHAPVGMDEERYKELELRDLQRSDEDNRVVLKIKDQSHLFTAGQGLHTSSSASTYTQRSPAQVLSAVLQDFGNVSGGKNSAAGLNLGSAIGVDDDSSSDEESVPNKKAKVGSKSTRAAATSQIFKAIKARHLDNDDYLLSAGAAAFGEQAAKLGLSQAVFDELSMTHNTTVEFLHYFWTVYLSGDSDRANEVGRLIETLEKSLDRIKVVADTAENERAAKVDQQTRENEAYTRRTGKKRRFDPNNIEGGAKAVNTLVAPLVRAIRSAKEQFEKALHGQMGQLAAASGS